MQSSWGKRVLIALGASALAFVATQPARAADTYANQAYLQHDIDNVSRSSVTGRQLAYLTDLKYDAAFTPTAAESFLAVSTKYEHSGKAPDSLLRLGQSLAALKKKEAACATLAEVGRKYPHASASVKRSVAAEQKRVHC